MKISIAINNRTTSAFYQWDGISVRSLYGTEEEMGPFVEFVEKHSSSGMTNAHGGMYYLTDDSACAKFLLMMK